MKYKYIKIMLLLIVMNVLPLSFFLQKFTIYSLLKLNFSLEEFLLNFYLNFLIFTDDSGLF